MPFSSKTPMMHALCMLPVSVSSHVHRSCGCPLCPLSPLPCVLFTQPLPWSSLNTEGKKLMVVIPPAVFLFFKIVFAILDFCFHMKLKIVLSRSVKDCVAILMGLH